MPACTEGISASDGGRWWEARGVCSRTSVAAHTIATTASDDETDSNNAAPATTTARHWGWRRSGGENDGCPVRKRRGCLPPRCADLSSRRPSNAEPLKRGGLAAVAASATNVVATGYFERSACTAGERRNDVQALSSRISFVNNRCCTHECIQTMQRGAGTRQDVCTTCGRWRQSTGCCRATQFLVGDLKRSQLRFAAGCCSSMGCCSATVGTLHRMELTK